MSSPDNRERDIFNSALDRPTKAERIAHLDGARGEDHVPYRDPAQ